MKQTPQIRLVFTLTKRDDADFDRDAVTRGLGILPTRSCPPTPGKGKVQHCGREIHEPDEQVLSGFTVLPAEAPPYPTLRHAYWSAELPKMDCQALDEPLSYVMAVEELSKVCGTTGVIVSAHTSLCAAPIYENGTPEQKAKYLPKLCSGEWLGAFGLTEPGAGTDAQGQQTIAKEEDDCWVLNGSKIFITNAGFADVFIVIAVTDRVLDKKGRPTKLCSAFIVERTDPGFSVGKAEDKMGIRGSSTCELIFEDCRIPKDRMLGVRGKGFQLAMATLDGGRIGIASQALGIAEGALEETVAYVKERKQFGRSISAFQNTQFELAEMKARVEAAKYLVYAAALKKQQAMDGAKVRYSVEAAQAKLIAARTASDVTRRCLQLFGGYGYTRDYPIERMMRDAKITEIYEGTSEVQMMVISGALLK